MNTQQKAKAAVELLSTVRFGSDDDIQATNYALSLLRPLADGTHVLAPLQPTLEMITASWEVVRSRWPTGKFLGVGPAFKEAITAAIKASQEQSK
jgi:hypothetical protein